MPLSALARRYRHFLLDLDGCLYVGDSPTERATEALAALREASKGIVFLTNDVGSSPEEIVRKLWRLGFQASLDEVMTAGAALQFMLADRPGGGAAYVIGSQAIVDHVAEAGLRIVNNTEFATRADIVVVADHERFDYGELRIATQAVLRGAELIGLSRDRTFPMPDGQWPGSGAVLAAVETACRPQGGRDRRQARARHVRGGARSPRRGQDPRPRRPARRRRARRQAGRLRLRARADRRHRARPGRRRHALPHPRRRLARGAAADVRRRRHQTHHKHSSTKGYRRLLDKVAAHEDVHRVATGRVKPRMGTGRPIAPISKVREIESGLSITINTDGAVIDAFVVTSDPAGVAAWLRAEGLAK